MSDERPGEIVSEVVALKPKMYSILIQTQPYWFPSTNVVNEASRAKGVPGTAKRKLTHSGYQQVLDDCGTSTATFRAIRSDNHVK